MTEELRTKDALSIGDLKNRIVHYERKLKADSTDELYAERRYDALALAWRVAFEWREGWHKRCQGIALQSIQWSTHCEEGDEGMRLIREKLQS